MNKQIKNLINQAHALAYEQHQSNCKSTGTESEISHAGALDMTFEKFAELMLGECADVLSRVPGGYDSSLFYKNITTLKKHFGVEE